VLKVLLCPGVFNYDFLLHNNPTASNCMMI